MAELANCSRCDVVFVKSIRDICQSCFKEEEKAYETVYRFLSVRKNREATMMEIVKATGIRETMITKFIKEKRLRTSQFPKLAYPCERCGVDIIKGKLCGECLEEIKVGLERHEEMEKRENIEKKQDSNIYYAYNNHKK